MYSASASLIAAALPSALAISARSQSSYEGRECDIVRHIRDDALRSSSIVEKTALQRLCKRPGARRPVLKCMGCQGRPTTLFPGDNPQKFWRTPFRSAWPGNPPKPVQLRRSTGAATMHRRPSAPVCPETARQRVVAAVHTPALAEEPHAVDPSPFDREVMMAVRKAGTVVLDPFLPVAALRRRVALRQPHPGTRRRAPRS